MSGGAVEREHDKFVGHERAETEGDWQRLWFFLRSKAWTALAIVPTDAGIDALKVAETLVSVGHGDGAIGLTLLNAIGTPSKSVQSVIDAIDDVRAREGAIVVACEAVDASPATLPNLPSNPETSPADR